MTIVIGRVGLLLFAIQYFFINGGKTARRVRTPVSWCPWSRFHSLAVRLVRLGSSWFSVFPLPVAYAETSLIGQARGMNNAPFETSRYRASRWYCSFHSHSLQRVG
jgi:hypothetical protein